MHKQTISDRGNAGTIIVVLIFSFLMTVSTAYIKMIQTETEVQTMMDQSDRAVDAAFSGINYTMALIQSKKETFKAETATQTYYITPPTPVWTALSISHLAVSNKISSDWLFLNEQLFLFDPGETASPPYRFRIHSYPGVQPLGVIQPASYTIKVQGQYRVYGQDQATILATYSAQLIAQCEIIFSRKVVQLKRWRIMQFETDVDFRKATIY